MLTVSDILAERATSDKTISLEWVPDAMAWLHRNYAMVLWRDTRSGLFYYWAYPAQPDKVGVRFMDRKRGPFKTVAGAVADFDHKSRPYTMSRVEYEIKSSLSVASELARARAQTPKTPEK